MALLVKSPTMLAVSVALAFAGLAACAGGDGAARRSAPAEGGPDGGTIEAGTPPGNPPAHVVNPYAGATFAFDPAWAASVRATAATTSDATLAAQMNALAETSTGVWLDAIARIAPTDGTMGLAAHLGAALSQQTTGMPVVLTLVLYDLPGRDCAGLASDGELPATADGLSRYEHAFVDPIAAILASPQYAAVRVAAILEPDSLPNVVTNQDVPACATASPLYEQGIAYALDALHPIANVSTFLDVGHSGWLGWPRNSGPAAQELAKVAQSTAAGLASVDGFVTNTSNYMPLKEPFMTATQAVGGQPVDSATFYDENPEIDEADYAAAMYGALTSVGFPTTIGMLVDTSRDGWGGAARPTGPGTSTDVNAFVSATKVDRRASRGLWCNVAGAGLGERPAASPPGYPDAHLDAFVWVKGPGSSDGTSADIPNDEGKKPDPTCDPSYVSPDGVPSGALSGAPLAGQWFSAAFLQLVQNADPPLP
ncbi:MAG TPA: glycoside hydrolase family 6 protein [Polyangiaceae bacterium]|jgi:cellulose 1,4-beta-cellobiosidase